MPGGLVRVAQDDHVRTVSIQSGAASKDVWIAGQGPADTFSLLKPIGRGPEIKRTGEAPPSRAMDNLFWLGRYTERAEGLVRVLRAVTARLGDDPAAAADGAERFLLPFAHTSKVAVREAVAGNDAKLREELRVILYDRKSPDSLPRLLGRVREAAWSVRDRLSLDTWRTIHILTEEGKTAASLDIAMALNMLDQLVRRAAAFSGLCAENMTRGPNWIFVDLGRRIERAAHQIWLVNQAAAVAESDVSRVRMMLEIADSAMTYRSRYLNQFDIAALIDLLLLDETNPRAVAFQFASLERNLRELPIITPEQRSGRALTVVGDARLAVTGANALVLADIGDDGKRVALTKLTAKIESAMEHLSNAITDAYFQHTQRHRVGAMPARETSLREAL